MHIQECFFFYNFLKTMNRDAIVFLFEPDIEGDFRIRILGEIQFYS
jgi:hypothetical protein